MARLWKKIDGEPYMINPRLGVLALQALNPKRRKKMAKHWGKGHMAWVRSFQRNPHKKRKHHYRSNHRRKRNPYPMAGTVAALGNPRRRRKHHRGGFFKRNPSIGSSVTALGLPGFEQIIYGGVGFVGTAAVQGVIDNFMPSTSNASTSTAIKYLEILGSIVVVSWIMKAVSGQAAGNLGAVGGGIFFAQQAAHDFAPGMIPGMHAYTPLKGPGMRAYTALHPSSTMGRSVGSAGGGMPQLALRGASLRAPAFGAENTVESAPNGGMNIVQARFRRFQ